MTELKGLQLSESYPDRYLIDYSVKASDIHRAVDLVRLHQNVDRIIFMLEHPDTTILTAVLSNGDFTTTTNMEDAGREFVDAVLAAKRKRLRQIQEQAERLGVHFRLPNKE